jgi:hypothetical protein
MSHTYEVFVDMREFGSLKDKLDRLLSARYEIDADSRRKADFTARYRAEHDYPKATEFDVRITRLLH